MVSVVDPVTQKLMISDTTLRSFIPPQVRKMTNKLRHICRCELCVVPKDMHIDLNIFRIRLVTYLKQNYVGIHTCNSLFSTKIYSRLKITVFPDGECLHANIKYAAQCIICLSIKPNNMIHIKFALVFFLLMC